MKVYTIGHSNLNLDTFLQIMQKYSISAIVDVRTKPYSKYARWTKKKNIENVLPESGIDYIYLGNELGGKPFEKMTDFYERERNPLFVVGIQKLIDIAEQKNTVILCSEANPDRCHRKSIIGKHLTNRGWRVVHIMRDGSNQEQQPMLL